MENKITFYDNDVIEIKRKGFNPFKNSVKTHG